MANVCDKGLTRLDDGFSRTPRDDTMRNDTILTVAGLTIILSGETRTFATMTINGREYTGEVGSPVGRESRSEWMDHDLLVAMRQLPQDVRDEVTAAIHAEMS